MKEFLVNAFKPDGSRVRVFVEQKWNYIGWDPQGYERHARGLKSLSTEEDDPIYRDPDGKLIMINRFTGEELLLTPEDESVFV